MMHLTSQVLFLSLFSSFVAYNIEINLKYHHFVNNLGNMRS